MSYNGAGILFVRVVNNTSEVLLAQRRRSRLWSISGGKQDPVDKGNYFETACRETKEEFGWTPPENSIITQIQYPFSLFGFSWITYVASLDRCLNLPKYFPDKNAKDFKNEFRDFQWFPIGHCIRRLHPLLHPLFLKLRMGGFMANIRGCREVGT